MIDVLLLAKLARPLPERELPCGMFGAAERVNITGNLLESGLKKSVCARKESHAGVGLHEGGEGAPHRYAGRPEVPRARFPPTFRVTGCPSEAVIVSSRTGNSETVLRE